MFKKVALYYRKGLYTDAQLYEFVKRGTITREQYDLIIETGGHVDNKEVSAK